MLGSASCLPHAAAHSRTQVRRCTCVVEGTLDLLKLRRHPLWPRLGQRVVRPGDLLAPTHARALTSAGRGATGP